MCCRKKLGKRLLFDKSVNNEHERSLLSKLKQYFGGQFTLKMEGMLNDVSTARDHQTKFEEYMRDRPSNHRVDFSVTVLQTGSWPSYKTSNINLPSEMVYRLFIPSLITSIFDPRIYILV